MQTCLKINRWSSSLIFNTMFYYKFKNKEDRFAALEANPIVIEEKPFIIMPWSLRIDKAREQILSTIWPIFIHIPSVLQPLIGLSWLASLIGDLKFF